MSSKIKRKPVQLHVMHDMGGGIERWVRDYLTADTSRMNLVLQPLNDAAGRRAGLVLASAPGAATPLHTWRFKRPISGTVTTHPEYRQAIMEIVEIHGVEAVIISSFLGHSLDVLSTGKPTVHVNHDYYPYCAAVNISFESICSQCELHRLKQCFRRNMNNQAAKYGSATEWQHLRDIYFALIQARQTKLVAPSKSVIEHLSRLDPRYRDAAWQVIPHGLAKLEPLPSTPQHDYTGVRKLRIVVPGVLVEHKGESLLREIIAELRDEVDFYLIGCGQGRGGFAVGSAREVIHSYERDDLPRIIRHIEPDIGMLLSTVPETFSYTLSELFALHVPVLATRLGSFGERIVEGESGFLVAPVASEIIGAVRRLSADREAILRIAAHLTSAQHRSTTDMVADYHRLLPLPSLPSVGRRTGEPSTVAERQLRELFQQEKTAAFWLSSWYRRLTGPLRRADRKFAQLRERLRNK